jgi:hypothetical protein
VTVGRLAGRRKLEFSTTLVPFSVAQFSKLSPTEGERVLSDVQEPVRNTDLLKVTIKSSPAGSHLRTGDDQNRGRDIAVVPAVTSL